ncbi:THAP domain-containing protein 2 [Frankliniella fusca]|uniref:THAP domain-containing protein 2 n=1 Tax=Frankliniella fusca TaxID=407009 RepID=A0AAE1I3G1_9NEOP|nr:THAP domain-containing protein 2 [Frankliniella fusca]
MSRRKKCVIRACPHHHFALDKIAGIPVRPLSFPHTRQKRIDWLGFVYKHNGTVFVPSKQHFICSAHFAPESFCDGKLKSSAVPTIDPEHIRKLAIENGDMRPVTLDTTLDIQDGEVIDAPCIVYLEEKKQNHNRTECGTIGKRKRIGDLCVSDFNSNKGIKIAFQLVNSTLKIWSGNGVANQNARNSMVEGGKELEFLEKCQGDCYNHLGMKENAQESDLRLHTVGASSL